MRYRVANGRVQMIHEPVAKLLAGLVIQSGSNWARPSAADYRTEAGRCRAVASECLHRPTGDALRELAAEYDAAANRLEATGGAKRAGAEFTTSLSTAS
jgi:hypothetical protein